MTDQPEDVKMPKQMTLDLNTIPLATDGLNAPTIFADFIRGAIVAPGVTKLNLVETRLDSITNEIKAIHVATLVVPGPQMRAWSIFFAQQADIVEGKTGAVSADAE